MSSEICRLLILRGAMGSGKSTVSKILKDLRPSLSVIEIDDIKIQKYGTTKKCNPEIDFTEAGQQALDSIEKGFNAVVVEPLCEQKHVDFVLHAANRTVESSDVSIVWLNCTVETALKRKKGLFDEGTIRNQHGRYASRYCPSDEVIIDTDNLSAKEVAETLLSQF